MNLLTRFQCAVVVVIGASLFAGQSGRTEEKPLQKTKRAWTLDETQTALRLQPRDPYLQYVVLQLARRGKKQDEVAKMIDELLGTQPDPRGRTARVDLFSIFTGALAVQESLQLDTMRGEIRPRNPNDPGPAPEPPLHKVWKEVLHPVVKTWTTTSVEYVKEEVEKDGVKRTVVKPVYKTQIHTAEEKVLMRMEVLVPGWPVVCASAGGMLAGTRYPLLTANTVAALTHERSLQTVDVATLTGPQIKSHPWEKMLAGRKPEVSPLARCVPDDFYFAEFCSLNKLIEALETSDLWSTHLFNQAVREARTQRAGERIQEQLAVRTSALLRPFYDQVVAEVAVTGSDLYLREGSDVTLLFQLKQPELFKARMDGFLKEAEKSHPGARTRNGEYLGVPYVHLGTPEREVHVFSAYPRPDLHVRSNSLPALQRVLAAIHGKDAEGKKVQRLGDTLEFAYIRTLLPHGDKEEDGLIYLSDPFIRRQVGPRVKLTEQRRMRCYNHLRMIGHASMLYRTEFGQAPGSLADLIKTGCAPGRFGEGTLACSDGGRYSLSADGNLGVCSQHGHALFLKPCCENPLATVTSAEATDYEAFLKDYNEYWRTYFDPIAIRIQVSPQRYRLETIVLPLIDNSIYTRLAGVLGGKPELLEALPVPKGNIFSVNFRLNKEALQKELEKLNAHWNQEQPIEKVVENEDVARALRELGVPEKEARKLTNRNIKKFLDQGLGNQIGFHVYDAEPHVDFNLPMFFGDMTRLANGRGGSDALVSFGLFLLSSANSPAYISLPIQDAGLVDDFVDALDAVSAALARHTNRDLGVAVKSDFYRIVHPSKIVIRGNGIQVGPVTWRFFTARIGKAFYIATKSYILEDLIAADAATNTKLNVGPAAHALIRVRPENWNKTLPDYRLGWSENRRQACLCNLGPLAHVGRAFGADRGEATEALAERQGQDIRRLAERLHTVQFLCPDGGRYLLDRDGRAMACSVHGSLLQPRQQAIDPNQAELNKLLRGLRDLTVTFTFQEDGLRAVLTIDRKE